MSALLLLMRAFSHHRQVSPQQYPSPVAARAADLSARNLPPEPDVVLIQFEKVRGSMGLSIVAAQVRIHARDDYFHLLELSSS